MRINHFRKRTATLVSFLAIAGLMLGIPLVQAADKPNILVIMPDDVGSYNISAYSRGVMGYRTPNIDSLAKEGALFTDHYGQLHRGTGIFYHGNLSHPLGYDDRRYGR